MKTEGIFKGFSPETFQFFADLEENNYKPWFDEHKHIYESKVFQPLKALAAALTPSFYEVDSQMEFLPNKMISRIYRDIRFSHDKAPYKNHMWIMFQRPFTKTTDEWTSFPGYYMEIGKEGINFGMGMFQAKKKIMDIYRNKVEYEQSHFRNITEGLINEQEFILGGEKYKRPIKNDLSAYFQPWIQRKGVYLHKHILVEKILYSEDFIRYMEKEFLPLHSLYEFFVDVCD